MHHTVYGSEFVVYATAMRAAWHCPPHAHQCYELLYVLEGCCQIVTSSGTYIAQPHHLVLFRPYQWHEETMLTPLYAVVCLRFPSEFAAEHQIPFPDPSVLPTVTPLPESEVFRVLLDQIVAEYQRNDSYSAAMIGTYLFQFAVHVQRALQQQNPADAPAAHKQAACLQRLLDQHITSATSIRDLAHKVHMSESHFSHQVKALLGVAPKTYVREQRIARARELLRSTQLSIEEIATALGYDHPASFFRAFKRATGLTPSRFRQHMRH
jgi:AraC family transcriptional activator of pobA